MVPFLPLLLGVVTGATVMRLAQKTDSRRCVKQAEQKLRQATVAGLESLEHSSSRLRHKLQAPHAAAESTPTGGEADHGDPEI